MFGLSFLEGKSEMTASAGKKLSDPNTRICPTQKKPGMDTFFVSEFINWTIGYVRIENRVGSGLSKPGSGCPNLKGSKKAKLGRWGCWACYATLDASLALLGPGT